MTQERFSGFRFDTAMIQEALELRHNKRLTYRKIARLLTKSFKTPVTYKTVYEWVQKFELRDEA